MKIVRFNPAICPFAASKAAGGASGAFVQAAMPSIFCRNLVY